MDKTYHKRRPQQTRQSCKVKKAGSLDDDGDAVTTVVALAHWTSGIGDSMGGLDILWDEMEAGSSGGSGLYSACQSAKPEEEFYNDLQESEGQAE